jgi:hypothetical protein
MPPAAAPAGNFAVTLPKITSPAQVAVLVDASRLEDALSLTKGDPH